MRPSLYTLLACLLACAPVGSGDSIESSSSLLGRSVQEPGDPLLAGPTWIFFTDKGSGEAAVPDPSLFHPSALDRRRRNRPGRDLLDVRDLPVHPDYIEGVASLGLQLRTTSRWLNAASVQSVGEHSEALRALPFVQRLQPVATAERPEGRLWSSRAEDEERGSSEPPEGPYGPLGEFLDRVGVPEVHSAGFTGEGVRVGVVDTGFRLEHEALQPVQSRVLDSWDFLNDDGVVANENPDEDQVNQDFHGSAVLGLLTADAEGVYVGAAPGIGLLLAKTESVPLEEPFEEDLWIAGVEWAEQNGAAIITSSLGWIGWYEPEDLDGETATSSAFAGPFSAATGVLLVQSAGNAGPEAGTILAPSDADAILAVGSVDLAGPVSSFSSRGPTADGRVKPDLGAPGSDVPVVFTGDNEGFGLASGTSLAAPLVAGIAALALEAHPDWTRAELVSALRASGDRAASPDNDLGSGLVDAWAVCGLPCSCVDADEDGDWDAACGGQDCDDSSAELNSLDIDGDGFSSCGGDCDDSNSATNPEATELPYDGIDQDCDGADLTDQDGDGFDGGPGGEDCGDSNPAVFPAPEAVEGVVPTLGGHELCADGWDNDCDGLVGAADPDCEDEVSASTASSAGTTTVGGCAFSLPGRRAGSPAAFPALLLGLCLGLVRRRSPRLRSGR